MPTGSGKTMCFSWLAAAIIKNGKRVGIGVHRDELVTQCASALDRECVEYGIIKSGCDVNPRAKCQICSIPSLARRLHKTEPFDFFIFDEVHHIVAGRWAAVHKWHLGLSLGTTATPCRLDGRGLAPYFDVMIQGPDTPTLISGGYLVQPIVYGPPTRVNLEGVHTLGGDYNRSELETAMDKREIYGDAVAHYLRLAAGKRAVTFCVSVKHADLTAQAFRAEGVPAQYIAGALGEDEVRNRVQWFRETPGAVLTSIDIISEGFDLPGIEAAILLRPSRSLGWWLQACGRALRTAPGKTTAIIIDHVGNSKRHGLPDWPRVWELTADKPKKQAAPSLGVCLSCYAVLPGGFKSCPYCGEERKVKERAKIKTVDVDLEVVESNPLRYLPYKEALKMARTPEQLKEMAHARGYHTKWVDRILGFRGVRA